MVRLAGCKYDSNDNDNDDCNSNDNNRKKTMVKKSKKISSNIAHHSSLYLAIV